MFIKERKKFNNPVVSLVKKMFITNFQLTQAQKRKCYQKFQSYKALGSNKISKTELRKVMNQLGKQASEQQLMLMIQQADPNGYGYINYQAFENMIQVYKQNKQEQRAGSIGLTYEQILRSLKKQSQNDYAKQITWEYLQKYLLQNFQLEINIKSMKSSKSTQMISKQEFKFLFS